MTVRVLVVDDSGFFRRRVVAILDADPGIEVIGQAANGREAVVEALKLKPDVITMDIEMPVMDGITAVRHIMARHPVPVLMFSSLTHEGAQATLDALDAGAADFLPKRFEDIAGDREEALRVLRRRVRTLGLRHARGRSVGTPVAARTPRASAPAPARAAPAPSSPVRMPRPPAFRLQDFRIVLIGTSTGGPVALQKVLTVLPADFPLPLLLVQHMPASFTPAFAQRLDALCAIRVKEAADGDGLEPGLALLAPGGRQMVLESRAGKARVRVVDSDPDQHYRPCVDVSFQSVAPVFGRQALAIIMTGMGADGREGVRLLKDKGAQVWTQDEASCVVFGMPAAVAEAGLSDRVLPVDEIGTLLASGMKANA
jgi:two-component system, chemotaxis family, protein-glutamate methylesterase/glutaminase